jgi:predicted metal-binding membrane protein
MWVRVDTRRPLVILIVTLSALAWLALWLWGQSPYSRFLSHHNLDAITGNSALALVFIAGWAVMVIAMMLPTSLPLITLFRSFIRQRPNRAQLVALLIEGYLGIGAMFGVFVYAGDYALHQAIDHSTWIAANAWMLGALTLILAGVYQFTPLKYYCLDKCRSPMSFILGHWHGRDEAQQAFVLGAHHGLFCIGCCWSLMLLMFVVGVGSLGWMLMLSVMMAIEKNVPWGRRLSLPLGVALLAWGALVLLSSVPTVQAHLPFFCQIGGS